MDQQSLIDLIDYAINIGNKGFKIRDLEKSNNKYFFLIFNKLEELMSEVKKNFFFF